jgi:ankyrin repeat protein
MQSHGAYVCPIFYPSAQFIKALKAAGMDDCAIRENKKKANGKYYGGRKYAFSELAFALIYESIDEALARGNLEAVQIFLVADPALAKAGANPRLTPLQQAILRNRAEIAAVLIEAGADVNTPDSSGRTPLHLAVERRNPEIVSLLLARKADPSRRDSIGWTPLHHAAAKNDSAVVRALLEGGSDTKVLSACGGTPLHEAAASGGVEIIALLLNHGVDPATVSQIGDTALSIARQRGDAAVISSIEKSLNTP